MCSGRLPARIRDEFLEALLQWNGCARVERSLLRNIMIGHQGRVLDALGITLDGRHPNTHHPRALARDRPRLINLAQLPNVWLALRADEFTAYAMNFLRRRERSRDFFVR